LSKVRERETIGGFFVLSNGKKIAGLSYNNNDLSGTLTFDNKDDRPSFEDFLQAFSENNWAAFVEKFIDDFEGPGRSIDYELDDFEEFIEGNSEGCEYEANLQPDFVIFNFGRKQEKLLFIGDDKYKYKNEIIEKPDILKELKKYITCGIEDSSNNINKNIIIDDVNSLFTAEQIIKLKKIYDEGPSDATEFESAIYLNKSIIIFSQEDIPGKRYTIRVEKRIYKKSKPDSSETIEAFTIKNGDNKNNLSTFKKALTTYIQNGGSPLDFKV
jgi:hypothetical protein